MESLRKFVQTLSRTGSLRVVAIAAALCVAVFVATTGIVWIVIANGYDVDVQWPGGRVRVAPPPVSSIGPH